MCAKTIKINRALIAQWQQPTKGDPRTLPHWNLFTNLLISSTFSAKKYINLYVVYSFNIGLGYTLVKTIVELYQT